MEILSKNTVAECNKYHVLLAPPPTYPLSHYLFLLEPKPFLYFLFSISIFYIYCHVTLLSQQKRGAIVRVAAPTDAMHHAYTYM